MLTTLEAAKRQLNIPAEDIAEDINIMDMIMAVSAAIETYCNRQFADDYKLLGTEEGEKPRLPYDIEDACLLWLTYRYNTGGSAGVASERIDGLAQINYSLQHIDGKLLPAPPAVLALLNPYRRPTLG